MATALEQLEVTLTAKISDFQNAMRQAGQDFDSEAGRIEGRNRQLTDTLSTQMQGVGAGVTFLASTLKGLISIAAVDTLIQAFSKAQESLASLNKQADETRLTVQQLLSLRVAGAGAGFGADELNKALSTFSEQSRKTQDDARGLYKALDQVGPGFRQAFADAPTQAARLELISKAMASLTDETKRDQLEQGAFGTTSDRLKSVLDQMGGSFSTLTRRAAEAGISLDADLAERADDAQKKLGLLHEIISDKLQIALVNIAEVIRSTVVPAFQGLIPFIETTAKEVGLIVTAYNTLATAAQLLASSGHIPDPRSISAIVNANRSDYIEPDPTHRDQEAPSLTVRPDRGAFKPTADLSKKPTAAADDEYDREEKRINKQIVALKGQEAAVGKVGEAAARAEASTRLWEAADEAKLAHTPDLTAKIDKLAEAYAKVKAHLDEIRLASDLAFEAQQIGRTQDEQAVFSRLRGSGVDPDSEAGERLAGQMRTIKNITDAKESASSFVKGLISDLENGVKAGKALENQLKRILEKLADKSIDKLISSAFGGFGGLFGGGGGATDFGGGAVAEPGDVLAGGFASGGLVGRDGKPTWIPASALRGAKQFQIGGGVPAILHAGEIVLNQAQQKNVAASMVSGPAGPINLTHAPVINGTGLSKDEVFAVVQKSNRDFARQIGPIFANWQRRHG